nr:MAG TPA: hypothetical protein [Caudoviricetes sp.]
MDASSIIHVETSMYLQSRLYYVLYGDSSLVS